MTANLVIDSSVVIKWFVTESLSAEALRLFADWQAKRVSCFVPDLMFVEAANILWKKRRQGMMTDIDVSNHMLTIKSLPFDVTASIPIVDDAVRIAMAHDRTAYDSMYLALARHLACPFVTADERLANAVAAHISNVIKLSDWTPSPPTTTPPATTTTP